MQCNLLKLLVKFNYAKSIIWYVFRILSYPVLRCGKKEAPKYSWLCSVADAPLGCRKDRKIFNLKQRVSCGRSSEVIFKCSGFFTQYFHKRNYFKGTYVNCHWNCGRYKKLLWVGHAEDNRKLLFGKTIYCFLSKKIII